MFISMTFAIGRNRVTVLLVGLASWHRTDWPAYDSGPKEEL